MSGFPNKEQIAQLRAAAATIANSDREIARLQASIKRDTEFLNSAKAVRAAKASLVLELLRSMDVAANHNCGWEQRVTLFLAELTDQAEEFGRRNP